MELNLLTKEQVFGKKKTCSEDIKPLSIFEEYGTAAEVTNYAAFNRAERKKGYGYYWLKLPILQNSAGHANVVDFNGFLEKDHKSVFNFDVGIRPAAELSSLCLDSSYCKLDDNVAACGEYPQTMMNEEFSKVLDKEYQAGNLRLTNKVYTIFDYKNEKPPLLFSEYEYNGSKYVGVDHYSSSDKHWFEVEPITWLIDYESNLAITEKILMSGVSYVGKEDFLNCFMLPYSKSLIKKYLDIMSTEMYVSQLQLLDDPLIKELTDQIHEIENMREELGLYQLVLEHNISNYPNAIEPIETIKAQDNRLLEKQNEIQNKIDNYRNEHKVLTKRIS